MLVSPNTAIGRRLNDLAEEFAALKGGWDNLSPLDAYHLRRCAHLGAACEALRTRSLTDSKTDLLQLVRMEGQFSRALREAGLSGTPEPQADEPDLDEYLGQDDATEGEDDDARD
jgi:hypothetical protein